MIYSTNRTTSLGDMSADVNESYFGIGAMSFMEECAHDELALFEAGIKSDIDEVMIGESGSELAALNEGFVQTAAAKIKEMMKKFIDWLTAITRSAIAKLTQLLVRDNAKFAAAARKKIITMKNKDKFKYKGKYLKDRDFSFDEETVKAIDSLDTFKAEFDKIKDKDSAETAKSDMEKAKDAFEKLSVSDKMEKLVVETEDGDLKLVEDHLRLLEDLSKKTMNDLKKLINNMKKDANNIAKKADKMLREAKDEDRAVASVRAEAAALYKANAQKIVSYMMALIKARAKVARSVVAKAMGATPKNEGFEYDEELTDAMIESAEYEYDSALEEMSEGSCKDCDDDDIEDDDYDEDDE